MNLRKIGASGEEMAEKHLKEKGYKILDKNYHASNSAEIDIIAQKDGLIVFIEVKTRFSLKNGYGREAVTKAKQANIRYCAMHYMTKKLKKEVACRFDVLEIMILGEDIQIQHIENAF